MIREANEIPIGALNPEALNTGTNATLQYRCIKQGCKRGVTYMVHIRGVAN